MIIIGSTELTYTTRTGEFFCPQCDESRAYRQRRKREFLTVYFIPLIPLQTMAEFVECSTCKETFEPNMLQMTADEIRTSKRRSIDEMIRRVLVVIVAADDEITEDELQTIGRFAQQRNLPDVTSDQVLREAGAIQRSNMDLLNYISHVAEQLPEEDKDLLVRHAFLAATAGGDLSESRQDLLKQLPDVIGISEMRFREIIANAANQ